MQRQPAPVRWTGSTDHRGIVRLRDQAATTIL